jgi:hypothetical protein
MPYYTYSVSGETVNPTVKAMAAAPSVGTSSDSGDLTTASHPVLMSGTSVGTSSDTGTLTTTIRAIFMAGVSAGGSSDYGILTNAHEIPPVRGLAPSFNQKDILNPHFHLPLTFSGINGGALVNEEDTGRDIVDCIKAIVGFTIGSREDMPEFGIPDLVFRQQREVVISQVREAIVDWEERSIIDVGMDFDLTDAMIWNILIEAGVTTHG